MPSNFPDRFHSYRPTKVQALGFGIGCAAATLVLGFGVGGWVTGGTAWTMTEEAAMRTRTDIGVALCVEEFMAAPGARERLAKLKSASWYDRDDLVAKGGYATLPKAQGADTAIATQCAMRLVEAPVPATTASTR